MSKIRYPKCPYCGTEYIPKTDDYKLLDLVTIGCQHEKKHRCENCGKRFTITVKIMFYARKEAQE